MTFQSADAAATGDRNKVDEGARADCALKAAEPHQSHDGAAARSESLASGSAAVRIEVIHADCRDALKELPDCSVDACVTDLGIGTAAEHLVCADLLLAGYRAFLADQNCPYDVAVDLAGRLVRIQVKATRRQRAIPQRKSADVPAYMFHVRRAGKGGARVYSQNDFDLLALVGIDIRAIAYLVPEHIKQTIHIRPPGAVGGKHFADFTFARAIRRFAP